MTDRVCPYLRTFDDSSRYVSRADEANGCYSESTDRPAYIALDFQDSTCLGEEFGRCSRYKSAGRAPVGRRERQLLILSAGLGGLLLVATCVFLGIMALSLSSVGGLGSGLFGGGSTEVVAGLSPVPTLTMTPTLTATTMVTDTATPTATPSPTPSPSPSPTPTSTPNTALTSPIPTPTPWPTSTPRPATPWVPPPTSTPYRTNTPYVTSTPSNTPTSGTPGTPTVTATRTSTPIPTAGCRTDDVMTYIPEAPALDELFIIEVCSVAAYTDVSITGPGNPRYNGLHRDGGKYCWRWEESIDEGGTYTYYFKIRSGASTCTSKSLTIAAPTNTPTITPTPTPFYSFRLDPVGPSWKSVITGTEPVEVTFDQNLRHMGNVPDTFQIWAEDNAPGSWTVEFCIGDFSNCFAPGDGQSITMPVGAPDQPLHVRAVVPPGAHTATITVTLKAQSMGDLSIKSQTVTIVVKSP